MIETLENNFYPVNKFKGEVFCSRYGLHVDWYDNQKGNELLLNVMYLLDGTHSIAEIANTCGVSFKATKRLIDRFHQHNLVKYVRVGL